MAVSIAEIKDAAGAIAGQVKRTPSVDAPRLAELVGAERVVLKLESQQFTGSFKDRGALVKLLSLTPEERKSGVVAMSAARQHPVPMRFVGVNDTFAESGKPEELLQKYGLTSAAIVKAALELVKA